MFWKKKDKGEDPKAAEPAREAPRAAAAPQPRPEPPRTQPPPQAPRPSAPPQAQPAPAAAAGKGAGAAIDAALTARRGPQGAPVSPDSMAAQARAADRLAASGESVDQQAARDLAAGQIDRGLDALRDAAEKVKSSPDRWRVLGALAFNVDAGRAKWAYEHLYSFEPRQFYDCLFLARLRGLGGQIADAREAATAALNVAANDVERGIAHGELGLIAIASKETATAMRHAEEAVAIGRRAGCGAGGPRDLVGRLVLQGDAALLAEQHAKARAPLAEALGLIRKDAQAAPSDTGVARAVCEVLEKCAAAASGAGDHAAAKGQIDEALNIRRKLVSALPGADGRRGLAQSLMMRAEMLRAAGDAAGARASYEECLGLLRQVGEAAPRDLVAQREVWVTMWRMAVNNVGMDWRQVVASMEAMDRNGALDEDGRKFLGEAKRRAAA